MESPSKKAIEKLIESGNRHDINSLGSIVAEDIVFSEPFLGPKPLVGREAFKKDVQDLFTTIPDVKFRISNAVVEGDKGAFELTFAGTQTGPLTGPEGKMPPTNRKVELSYAIFIRVNAKGLIQELREYYDTGSFNQQLGLTAEP